VSSAAIAAIAVAQTTQQTGVRESVVVRAAEIEVLVLDSKGRPVTDLRRDEFLLTVDGRPRKIDWVLPPPARKGEVVAVQKLQVDLPETPSLSPAPALPHSTVFFVDDMHLDFRSRYMGLRAIEVHANTLPLEEEVAVYTFRRRLEIVQRFTTDRTEVTASVKRLGKATPASFLLHGPVDWVGESQAALQGLSQMLTTLSGRPEPKTVILLGGYLPVHSLGRPDPYRPDSSFDFRDEIRQAERDAFLARATVVALDPSGIHPFGPGLDQQAPTPIGAFGSSSQTPAPDDSRSDIASSSSSVPSADHLESGGDAFAVLAHDTGGSRLSTSNQPEKLLAAETELLNSRYRIGFTPDAVSSQTRSIAIAVTRSGLRVRTAAGQRSLSGETMVRSRFASALLSRDLPLADFPIRVDSNKPPKGWFGTKTLSFEIRLPAREVYVEDRGETLSGGVEVLVATADDQGGISDIRSQAVEVRISKSDASRIPHAYFKIPLSLHVGGKGLLLVGVRDTTTNRLGHARVSYGK
jgi:VWFA-related protein